MPLQAVNIQNSIVSATSGERALRQQSQVDALSISPRCPGFSQLMPPALVFCLIAQLIPQTRTASGVLFICHLYSPPPPSLYCGALSVQSNPAFAVLHCCKG